jgi:superfamily II DNA/RNA helicase
MLDMGFIPDIERIVKLLPFTRQTLFFSATMPDIIQKLVREYLHTPVKIEVARQATTASTITQDFKFVASQTAHDKRAALRDLLNDADVSNGIIFCNRKRDVGILQRSLIKHGFSSGELHGDMDQHTRTKTLEGFRNNEITLLCASDVAARGLDIPSVSHVFNYDIPHHAEDYVHRIGRTGRAGKEGHATSLVTSEDLEGLKAIQELCQLEELSWIGGPPSDEEQSSERRRGGRGGRSRSRGGRSSRGDKNTATAEEKAPEAAAVEEEKPTSNAPQDDQHRNRSKPSKSGSKPPRDERPGRKERGGRRKKDEPVIGMGDHVPAFMTKPVKTGQ